MTLGQYFIAVVMGFFVSLAVVPIDKTTDIEKAINYSKQYTPKAKYTVLVDFSKPADQHRLFLINVDTKEIEYSWYTSHGKNSGGLNQAVRFSNIPGSKQSSLGVYKTAETYFGKHGLSLRLDGLSLTNSNVRARSVVLHNAQYVSQSWMKYHNFPGRSDGCITLDPAVSKDIIEKLGKGSVIYVVG